MACLSWRLHDSSSTSGRPAHWLWLSRNLNQGPVSYVRRDLLRDLRRDLQLYFIMNTSNEVIIKEDSIVASVIEKFKQRSALGIAKYGVTLDRSDLSILDWIQHAQEELMDGILYLEKLKSQFSSSNTR
jgi:hypothetical protein